MKICEKSHFNIGIILKTKFCIIRVRAIFIFLCIISLAELSYSFEITPTIGLSYPVSINTYWNSDVCASFGIGYEITKNIKIKGNISLSYFKYDKDMDSPHRERTYDRINIHSRYLLSYFVDVHLQTPEKHRRKYFSPYLILGLGYLNSHIDSVELIQKAGNTEIIDYEPSYKFSSISTAFGLGARLFSTKNLDFISEGRFVFGYPKKYDFYYIKIYVGLIYKF